MEMRRWSMRTMGEVISGQRKEKGMTQAELAAKMNVTDKAVSKWERDLSCPDVNSLSTLAEVLEVPVDELLNAKKHDAPKSKAGDILGLILMAVPLAMGVAVAALSALNQVDAQSAVALLGIGLVCLSFKALLDREK